MVNCSQGIHDFLRAYYHHKRADWLGNQPHKFEAWEATELEKMCSILKHSLEIGYGGLSTDALPFHYLAAHPHCEKTIPTQFAKYPELKKLTKVLRDKNAVWQATPPKDSVIDTLKTFLLTSARVHGKALKTTVVAALDIVNNWKLSLMVKTLSRLLNSRFIGGDFHMQALGARFKIWSDGAITPIAEAVSYTHLTLPTKA